MTTDDLHPGQPAATPAARTRRALSPLLSLLLALPAAPLLAAPEPAPIVPETIAPATSQRPSAEMSSGQNPSGASPTLTAAPMPSLSRR